MGKIPRILIKVTGWLDSSYGKLPYEDQEDKQILISLIQIYEQGLKEKRIVIRKPGTLPQLRGATTQERAALTILQAHTLKNINYHLKRV